MTYIWGIPTRFDVKDPSYLRLVEELAVATENLVWPTTTINLHNHVNNALRAGHREGWPADIVYQKLPFGELVALLSPGFIKFLNPEWILNDRLKAITRYLECLETVRKRLDHQTTVESSTDMGDMSDVSGLVTISKLPEGKKRGYHQMLFSYSFNPYLLARKLLSNLKNDLEQCGTFYRFVGDKIGYIHALYSVLTRHENRPALDLVEDTVDVWHSIDWEIRQLENSRSGSGINQMIGENKRIAALSDAAVRFDGSYIDIHDDQGIHCLPFYAFMETSAKLTSRGLSIRTKFRDLIEHLLIRKSHVVVNGFDFNLVSSGLLVSGKPPQDLINCLGIETYCEDKDVTLIPKAWVYREVDLVRRFRELEEAKAVMDPPVEVTKELLDIYDGWGKEGSAGILTQADRLSHIYFALQS